MARPKPLQALSAATLQLLRPLVTILLRNNVSHRTFAELAKRVYVEVANAEFGIAGKKQTTSRIAILTGLTRKEVQRLLAQPPDTEPVSAKEYHRASRVITGWVRDPDFGDGKGHPHPLRMEGKRASFSTLVKRYSGDIPIRAMADELLRVGAVKQLKDGRICLLSRGYTPQKGPVEKLQVLGSDTADLIMTIDHNLTKNPPSPASNARSCTATCLLRLPKIFRRWPPPKGRSSWRRSTVGLRIAIAMSIRLRREPVACVWGSAFIISKNNWTPIVRVPPHEAQGRPENSCPPRTLPTTGILWPQPPSRRRNRQYRLGGLWLKFVDL